MNFDNPVFVAFAISTVVVFAAVATVNSPAVAAGVVVDHANPPIAVADRFDWSGFYVGASAGAIWADTQWNDTTQLKEQPFEMSGGLEGATLGYGMMLDHLLLGIEGDYSLSGLSGDNPACGGPCTSDLKGLGTLRGRLGVVLGDTGAIVPYLTAGVAMGNVENNVGDVTIHNSTVMGWTVGAGAEMAIAESLSMKAEYLYVDLGESLVCTVGQALCGGHNGVSDFIHSNVIRVGINYHF